MQTMCGCKDKANEYQFDIDSEKSKETVNTGYYDIFNTTDSDRDEIATIVVRWGLYCELANVGAGLGNGFENTQELCDMTYQEATNGPDGDCWKEEVDNEFNRILKNKVFKVLLKKDLPPGTKVIDIMWAMKKKSSSTLHGRLNARGFKQIKGQH